MVYIACQAHTTWLVLEWNDGSNINSTAMAAAMTAAMAAAMVLVVRRKQ